MNVVCYPSVLSGTVRAIPSKSDAHRKLICAALSNRPTILNLHAPFCDDIAATIRCLKALGADFTQEKDGLCVCPIEQQPHADLDCGESGSTLRFLLPVAMTVCENISVTGKGRLPERPIGTLVEAMSAHGVHFSRTKLPLQAAGALTGGVYEIEGNISSQFLSGLLMALPLCDKDSEIRLTTPLQSSKYVDMTLDTLRSSGVEIETKTENGLLRYVVKSKQNRDLSVPSDIDGDWSNAAFWLTAGAIQPEHEITVSGISPASIQGDKAIAGILKNAGANVTQSGTNTSVSCGTIRQFDVSMEEIPDLLPILAVRAACGSGESHFTNAERLRIKESDRLASTAQLLHSIGGRAAELSDGLTVYGGQLTGGTVNAENDHRLVMAAAIAALRCAEPVTIIGAEAVNKSYPSFFEDYQALGGKIQISD